MIWDDPTPRRDSLTSAERAAIAEFERMHGVTVCPPATFSDVPVQTRAERIAEECRAAIAQRTRERNRRTA